MASFEYVLVGACIIGVVAAIFSPGATADISAALATGIAGLASLITTALAA